MRLARLLPPIYGDATRGRELHAGRIKSEAGRVGLAAEGVEEMAGAADHATAGGTVFEGDGHTMGVTRHAPRSGYR